MKGTHKNMLINDLLNIQINFGKTIENIFVQKHAIIANNLNPLPPPPLFKYSINVKPTVVLLEMLVMKRSIWLEGSKDGYLKCLSIVNEIP